MSRMDGATPWSTELALNKAYTATLYTINTDTSRLAHRSLTVMSQGKIMAGAGGLAIMGAFGAVTIGGIGVAGAATNDNDLSCARAGGSSPGQSPLTRGSQPHHGVNGASLGTFLSSRRRVMSNHEAFDDTSPRSPRRPTTTLTRPEPPPCAASSRR